MLRRVLKHLSSVLAGKLQRNSPVELTRGNHGLRRLKILFEMRCFSMFEVRIFTGIDFDETNLVWLAFHRNRIDRENARFQPHGIVDFLFDCGSVFLELSRINRKVRSILRGIVLRC